MASAAAGNRLDGNRQWSMPDLPKRLTLRGFIVTDFADQSAAFQRDMKGWLREGRVKYREDIVDGLENAPSAFIGLLKGMNFGKLIVRVVNEI